MLLGALIRRAVRLPAPRGARRGVLSRLIRGPESERNLIATPGVGAVEESVQRMLRAPETGGPERFLDVGIVGTPNCGKSTLVNALVGRSVSAVAPKYNTTRKQVMGILTQAPHQIILSDTPGICSPQWGVVRAPRGSRDAHYFGDLVEVADSVAQDVDALMWMDDAAKRWSENDQEVCRMVTYYSVVGGIPLILVENKVDLIGAAESLRKASFIHQRVFEQRARVLESLRASDASPVSGERLERLGVVPGRVSPARQSELPELSTAVPYTFHVSALRGEGLEPLLQCLKNLSTVSPWVYSPGVYTTESQQSQIEEMVREKIYRNYHKEIPYRVSIRTKQFGVDARDRLDVVLVLEVPSASLERRLRKGAGFIAKVCAEEVRERFGREALLEILVKQRAR